MMKPAKIPLIKKSFLFSDDHWLLHTMNVVRSNFNSYIYTLFLDSFLLFHANLV